MEIKIQNSTVLLDEDVFKSLELLGMKMIIGSNGYVKVVIATYGDGKPCLVSLHKIIMRPLSTILVDHINLNKLDNRKINLRLATPSQNMANMVKTSHKTTSVFRGVKFSYKKWVANARKDLKIHYLGVFACEVEAALAYNKKHTELFGYFSRNNDIPEDHICGERCRVGPSIPYA